MPLPKSSHARGGTDGRNCEPGLPLMVNPWVVSAGWQDHRGASDPSNCHSPLTEFCSNNRARAGLSKHPATVITKMTDRVLIILRDPISRAPRVLPCINSASECGFSAAGGAESFPLRLPDSSSGTTSVKYGNRSAGGASSHCFPLHERPHPGCRSPAGPALTNGAGRPRPGISTRHPRYPR